MTREVDVLGTLVFDLDGVLYVGSRPVPGAGATLDKLQSAGWTLLFATNNSSRTVDDVAAKIERVTGYEPATDSVITSGLAVAHHVKVGSRIFVVGERGLADTLKAHGHTITLDPQEADTVVAGVDFDITYNVIAAASTAVRAGADFVATNTDATFPTAEGLMPGAGAGIAAIATAAGQEPVACGKPHRPMGELVLDRVQGEHIWMIGDRLETDIALGKEFDWHTVLVRTGVTEEATTVPDVFRPDHTIDSIADLPALVSVRR